MLDHYETSITVSGNGTPPTYPSSTTDAGVGVAYGGIGTSLSGTITPVFRCTDNTGDPTLYVKITAGASASQRYGSNDAAASDGMGDPSVPGYRGYPPFVAGYSSNGVHLVQKQAPGSVQIGTLVSLSPIMVSANGVSETIGLKAVPDSRGVTIGYATSKKAPALDTSGNQTTDANGDPNFAPVPNDAGVGDTVYSYHSYSSNTASNGVYSNIDVPVLNWIVFSPNFIGNWHWKTAEDHDGNATDAPDVVNPDTWSWSPDESDDYWDYGKCEMPFAPKFQYQDGQPTGQDGSQQYQVSYTATDNTDSATATANYAMTVHDPYENNYTDHVTRGIENVRMAPNAAYVRSTQDDSTLTVYAEQGDSWSIGVSVDGQVGKWLAANLGINGTYTYSYNAGVQTSLQHVNTGYATYLEEFDAYKYHVGKVDVWSAGGYGGTAPCTRL